MARLLARFALPAIVAVAVLLATRGLSDGAFVTLGKVVAAVGLLYVIVAAATATRSNS